MAGGCNIERERKGDRTIFRVSGVFDRTSAAELRAQVEAERALDVILDFSLVREFADLGVAALASGLVDAARPLRLRGLCHHQLLLFRYFGVDVEALAAGITPDPDTLH